MEFYGVDVSKDALDIACSDGSLVRIENSKKAIKSFLRGMPKGCCIAMESTNRYHLLLADTCYAAGMVVYVVNPRVTRHYREALSLRGHTDRLDARTILSFITHHHQSMRVYAPKTAEQTRLASLVRRRAKLSALQVQMKQSLQGIPELRSHLLGLTGRIDRMIAAIDLLIDKQLDGSQDRARLESIKGVGPVVSAALLADLAAGEFRNADAFVAFYGLDPAPNDSGRSKGKRKISKKGHRLGRSMLYVAALSASCSKAWKPLYERFLAKGLSRVQALVCLARRIARAAWSIYTHKTTFDPKRITAAA